jgi:ribosomal protein S18 acetylase RimI-like enzyme
MEIRPIRAGEHDEAGRVVLAAYRSLDGADGASDYDAELAAVERRSRQATVVVAAEHDGAASRVLGCVTLVDDPGSPMAEGLERGELGIRMLGVLPSEQGRGIGEQLLRHCIDQARSSGRTAVFLHTTPRMAAAQRLYERLGFERQPARDWTPVPGVSLIAYRLVLDTKTEAS